jgi:alanyl-tRNA synthetase
VEETGDIGLFLITSEGSAAAGIRRIEAVTGRSAYELVQRCFRALKHAASLLDTNDEDVPVRVEEILDGLDKARKQVSELRRNQALQVGLSQMENVPKVEGVHVFTASIEDADVNALRGVADYFRQKYPSGVAFLVSGSSTGLPAFVAAVTEDLVDRGLNAVSLVRFAGNYLGGSGGGRPTLAQGGGKDASRLDEALASVPGWVKENLRPV